MAQVLRNIARRIDALDERFGRVVSWIMLAHGPGRLHGRGPALRLPHEHRVAAGARVAPLRPRLHARRPATPCSTTSTCGWTSSTRAGRARKKAWSDFILLPRLLLPVGHHDHLDGHARSCGTPIACLEGSPDPGGIPLRFLLKSVIIVGFAILMVQAFSQTVKNFFWAMGWEEPEVRGQGDPLMPGLDQTLAALMFAGMIAFLFFGFPVAFSLTFTGPVLRPARHGARGPQHQLLRHPAAAHLGHDDELHAAGRPALRLHGGGAREIGAGRGAARDHGAPLRPAPRRHRDLGGRRGRHPRGLDRHRGRQRDHHGPGLAAHHAAPRLPARSSSPAPSAPRARSGRSSRRA